MPRLGDETARKASRIIRRQFGAGTPEELEMHEALGMVAYHGNDRDTPTGRRPAKPALRIPEFYDEREERIRAAYQGSSNVPLALVHGFNRGTKR